MLENGLRRPLRLRSSLDRLWASKPSPLSAAALAMALTVAGAAFWLARQHDPRLGEPVVHLRIEPTDLRTTASIAPVGGRLLPAPAKGLSEKGPDGPLPKIGRDGRRPADVYARPVHRAVLRSGQPKIAILLGGLGLDGELTRRAARDLPGEVTFAFAPYGKDLQSAIAEARALGHEVMLHLPMEPFGYPAEDPGPRTLLASASEQDNRASLLWHLSRFSGYTGVVNYRGARLLSEEAALAPVLRELEGRGLVFLDDGSSARSRAADIASGLDLSVLRADVVLDSGRTSGNIDDGLRRLEEIAKSGHIAIGIGAGRPATIDALAAWARDLEARGILLVPVSAGFRPG